MIEQGDSGLPINLLIQGRSCLVVGGGKVAFRKIRLLLDAGAIVSSVSPEMCDEVKELSEKELITHQKRDFEQQDVEGAMIVFAATNCRPINRHILEACRKRNILCCCVDGNWSDADFTTPAITRQNGLTVSVSSNGRNCRQSKMVKNSLARHLEMINDAHLVVVGTDHRHLNGNEREPFHLTGHRLERAGLMIMQLWGIHEFMVLNTCNRVEVIAIVSEESGRNGILRHILGFDRLKEDGYYLKRDEAAFEHLCLVNSGMLSQTPGETHIAAQMKEALALAKERGWANNMMQEWISTAQHVSKQIRTETSPLLHNYEIEDLTLKYLESEEPDLLQKTVLILGAGMVGQGLVRDSLPIVKRIVWCYHMNKPHESSEWDGRVELCTFNALKERIAEADIIISATEAPGHLLHQGHAPFFNQEKPVRIIDLGMPRNIDPLLDDLSADITVTDLDGLKYWFRREQTDMDGILAQSRKMVKTNHNLYEKIARSFELPTK